MSQIRVDRKLAAKLQDFGFNLGLNRRIALFAIGRKAIHHLDNPIRDLLEFGLAEATCCSGR